MTDCAHPEPFTNTQGTKFILVHDRHCPVTCGIVRSFLHKRDGPVRVGSGNAELPKAAKPVASRSPSRNEIDCPNCKTPWAMHPTIPGTSEFYCHIYPLEKVRR